LSNVCKQLFNIFALSCRVFFVKEKNINKTKNQWGKAYPTGVSPSQIEVEV